MWKDIAEATEKISKLQLHYVLIVLGWVGMFLKADRKGNDKLSREHRRTMDYVCLGMIAVGVAMATFFIIMGAIHA